MHANDASACTPVVRSAASQSSAPYRSMRPVCKHGAVAPAYTDQYRNAPASKLPPNWRAQSGAVNRASTVPTAPLTPPADEAEQSISCYRKALLIMKMPPTFRPWSSQLTYQSKSGLATPPRQHVPPTRGQYRLHICQLRQHTSPSSPCDAVRLSPHCASKAR